MTIAGSDSGGGAGIQADLKAFARLGCHGMTAVTALTAQGPGGVRAVHEVPAEFVVAQLEVIFSEIGADAVKTGMLFGRPVIDAVAAFLARHRVPLVVDPVMVSSAGSRLLREDAVAALVSGLLPLATVVTPNLPEACALAGIPYSDSADRRELAGAIAALGPAAVLITGGHGDRPVDSLLAGGRYVEIPVERLPRAATHGSGCTHSAALAALLARGAPLEEAAREAAAIASDAVAHGLVELGAENGPVDVLHVVGR